MLPVQDHNFQYLAARRDFRKIGYGGSYFNTAKKLESLRINWRAGVTVQVLTPHPYHPTSFRWAHNVLETKPTKLKRFNNQAKPSGWGNGGGGLEKLIYVPNLGRYLTELQILELRHPGHRILTDRTLPKETKTILAGGLREFADETGFRDIDICTDYPGVFLSEYVYPDWIDDKGISYRGGHRKITLWGKLKSLREDSIIESNEIDKTDWFDLSESLPGQFFNRSHERPYLSHVITTLGGMLRIYRYEKEIADGFIPNIPKRVHPSWWYAYQIGRGDSRFPDRGYKLLPVQWYKLFKTMVDSRMEEADNDFLFKFAEKSLDKAFRREEEEFKISQTESSAAKEVKGLEDSEAVPTLDDMIRREDEEYARWFESTLPAHLRVTVQ